MKKPKRPEDFVEKVQKGIEKARNLTDLREKQEQINKGQRSMYGIITAVDPSELIERVCVFLQEHKKVTLLGAPFYARGVYHQAFIGDE